MQTCTSIKNRIDIQIQFRINNEIAIEKTKLDQKSLL